MSEIEVGDYVRINADFRLIALGIGKVVGINKDSIHVKMNFELPFSLKKENIANHSKQLIDLIKVGDIVNGYRVLAIESSIYENSKRILIYRNEREKYERWIYIQEYNGRIKTQDDIVVILTKEQFEANCYKVGGEE